MDSEAISPVADVLGAFITFCQALERNAGQIQNVHPEGVPLLALLDVTMPEMAYALSSGDANFIAERRRRAEELRVFV